MRHILLGFLYAFLAAIGFSLLVSLTLCCGVDPETRIIMYPAAPLLGILAGSYFASRTGGWRIGLAIGLVYVALWIGFWMYLMGRLNPVLWIEEGLSHLTISHLAWWGAAILCGGVGGIMGWSRKPGPLGFLIILCFFLIALVLAACIESPRISTLGLPAAAGYQIERQGPATDGTVLYLLSFDFRKQNRLNVGLYDCDIDDSSPYDDSNTSYMGQSLEQLVHKLSTRSEANHRQLFCAINGGFFGASGLSIAHHEEPIVQNDRVLYNVDLLKPKDQAWFFAVNSPANVRTGHARFIMAPIVTSNALGNYQTVLGGVRPLRVNGKSLLLQPGAGSTSLRCSRTSIGWSADGNQFYILVIHDPDGEAASQLQRKTHHSQTGGWDVSEVQKFWEQKQIPNALLFDGGESTQLAFRSSTGEFHFLPSGYQYSFTLGYLFQKPLLFTLPILPPSEAHRGVLNYLYVEGLPSQPSSE